MLPVFYHIPKAAGTFVLGSYIAHVARACTYNKLAFVDIRSGDADLFRTVADDRTGILSDTTKFTHDMGALYHCNYSEWCSIKDQFDLKLIIVTGNGFMTPLEDMLPVHNTDSLYKFTILRDVFERSLSLFSYLNSQESRHEVTHKTIPHTYGEYVDSIYIEDSWLIRKLINHDDAKPIDDVAFDKACSVLDNINIYDFNGDITSYVSNIFEKCTGITSPLSTDGLADAYKNVTQHKVNVDFNDLDLRTRKKFLDRTYWDRKIYDRYIKRKVC